MNKEILEQYLKEGKSTREIQAITGKHHNTVAYWIKKHGLKEEQKFKKTPNYKIQKVDSKEKAYLLGFLVADGSIGIDKGVEINVQLKDKEVVDYLANIVNGNVTHSKELDKKKRRFPRARLKKKITDINTFVGGDKKADRHFPIVGEEFERYLLLGFFDADGCITWGRRKDRNRIWQKVSFTSSLKILVGVQQFLLKKLEISTILRPKTNCDCFVLEFSNKKDVLKILDYLYQDKFVVLKRKYLKAKALRLELEENGETHENGQYRAEPTE